MVPKGDKENNRNYYRFQLQLSSENAHDQMDNASPSNIEHLQKRAEKLIEHRKTELKELCDILKNETELYSDQSDR